MDEFEAACMKKDIVLPPRSPKSGGQQKWQHKALNLIPPARYLAELNRKRAA